MKKLAVLFVSILFISCSNYGEKVTFNGTDVHYKEGVSKAEAEKLGQYLVDSEFADGKKKSVQLVRDKETNNLTFRMVVADGTIENTKSDYIFNTFVGNLSETFDYQPVDMHLCNNRFETLKVHSFNKAPKSIQVNATQIIYTDKVTLDEVNKLKDYLVDADFADDSPKTIEFDKKDGKFLFRMVVKEGFEKQDSNARILKIFGDNISKEAFGGAPLEVHMCNDTLETLRIAE